MRELDGEKQLEPGQTNSAKLQGPLTSAAQCAEGALEEAGQHLYDVMEQLAETRLQVAKVQPEVRRIVQGPSEAKLHMAKRQPEVRRIDNSVAEMARLKLKADDRCERVSDLNQETDEHRNAAPCLHKPTDNCILGHMGGNDPGEARRKKDIEDLLDKMTPKNYERIKNQLLAINMSDPCTLRGLVDQVFEKALSEPSVCEMYAQLCFDLKENLPKFPASPPNKAGGDPGRELVTFRTALVCKCRFEIRGIVKMEAAFAGPRQKAKAEELKEDMEVSKIKLEDATAGKPLDDKAAEKEKKDRMHALQFLFFTGKLYKKRVLHAAAVHACIEFLLAKYEDPQPESVECLCKMLMDVGFLLDNGTAKDDIDGYFRRINAMSFNQELESRHRLMLQDLMDLHANKWQARHKAGNPDTVEEIHRDAHGEVMQDARWWGWVSHPCRRS